VEPELSHEDVSSAKAEPTPSIERPSPKPKDPKEGFQPSDFSYFEDEFFKDFGNTSKYACQKRPPVPVTPSEPLDKESLKESIKELSAIMSSEWLNEGELSSEEIQIHTPSQPVRCKIQGNWLDALYNPTVGANLMSSSFAHAYLGNEPLAPTAAGEDPTPLTKHSEHS